MVKIIDYAERENAQGESFFTLIVQGGVELVKNESTGKSYLTARKCSLPTTFDETTCKSLIGDELPGSVVKVDSDPYDYTIQKTGEVISIDYTYEYVIDNTHESLEGELGALDVVTV